MKKKFNHYVSLSLLLLSVLPFSLVSDETVEEVPTGDTTISSIVDDPLEGLKEKPINQVPTIESSNTESKFSEDIPTSEPETKEDVLKTEETNETKPKSQARVGEIGTQAVNLIEGVDIDASFAATLRSYQHAQNLGTSWSGYGKGVNQLTDEDMAALTSITLSQLINIDSVKGIEYAVNLKSLVCKELKLTELDVSKNTKLTYLECSYNLLVELDVTNNVALTYLDFYKNQISKEVDLTNNTALTHLNCSYNPSLGKLDVTNNTALTHLYCGQNPLGELDVTKNTALTHLMCWYSELSELDVTNNTALTHLNCEGNQLSELNVSNNKSLKDLRCGVNQIADISSAYGLNKLTYSDGYDQELWAPVPSVSASGEAVVDILKSTTGAGLSAFNGNIIPAPTFNYNGDKILLSNVTRESLADKFIEFEYDPLETKVAFGGKINFFPVSVLDNNLKPEKKKIKSGDKVEWTWTITSLTNIKAENIRATLDTLPSGVTIDSTSLKKDGSPTSINDLYGIMIYMVLV